MIEKMCREAHFDRVGIFGGTFDPVHEGHLQVAEYAQRALRLDRLILVPAARPWMKEKDVVASGADRLRMLELTLRDRPAMEVSGVDLDREGLSYSVDTVGDIKTNLPASTELFFLAGADALIDFHKWREPERLLEQCTVVAIGRPGQDVTSLDRRMVCLAGPGIGLSGTEIRRRLALGLSVHGLVPKGVMQHIRNNRLYGLKRAGRKEGAYSD